MHQKKMKYIIVGPAWPFRGGIAAFNERLARQLIDEGHEVLLYTFTLQYPRMLFPGKTQFSTDPAPKGLTIRRCFSSVNPFSWWKARRLIRRQHPDVVIFAYWMSFMAPCFGTIAARLGKNVRRIGLIHNLIPHEPNLLDKLFPPYFVRRMDGFVTLSQSVANDVRRCIGQQVNKPASQQESRRTKNGSKQIAVTPHPLYDHYGELFTKSEARCILRLNLQARYVLFFGLVRAYKGLDLLLEALADSRLADVRLIIAGEFYDNEQSYRDKIQTLGLYDRVVIYNYFIPDAEVCLYFNAADIVCQPYKTATQSGVTQIAYHFCKPMLVTDVGGLSEIVPHGPVGTTPPSNAVGYVVPSTPSSIADALVDFYQNDRESSFIQAASQEKKKYAWTNLTQALYGLL